VSPNPAAASVWDFQLPSSYHNFRTGITAAICALLRVLALGHPSGGCWCWCWCWCWCCCGGLLGGTLPGGIFGALVGGAFPGGGFGAGADAIGGKVGGVVGGVLPGTVPGGCSDSLLGNPGGGLCESCCTESSSTVSSCCGGQCSILAREASAGSFVSVSSSTAFTGEVGESNMGSRGATSCFGIAPSVWW